MIETELYKQILGVLPIVCVDIVIRHDRQYLLLKRTNEPLKDEWWVPGGRVLKGETLEACAHRKAREECGIAIRSLKLMGFYEDVFLEVHSISAVFSAEPFGDGKIVIDSQSSEWKWADKLPKRFRIVD